MEECLEAVLASDVTRLQELDAENRERVVADLTLGMAMLGQIDSENF